MNVLVTGAAGFIGSNLCMRLLEELSDTLVVGLDNLNAYYDVNIKRWRLEQLTGFRERFVLSREVLPINHLSIRYLMNISRKSL